MLIKDRIFLRLMEEEDIEYKVRWFNDEEVRKTLNTDYPISNTGTKKWLNSISTSIHRKDFIVVLKETNKPVGYAGLLNIDYINSKAESYLGIGDKDEWGKGLASEVREAVLDYGFYFLSLNKIYSFVRVENKAMYQINKNVGFQKEGLLRDDIFYEGKYYDKYIMGLLKNEYIKKG